ncbi:helix-turn-helix transcriptional regulator [Microbacterium aurum]
MDHPSLHVGDAVLISPGSPCGVEPTGSLIATSALINTRYAVDQVFWQHSDLLRDRRDTVNFLATQYAEPVQILRLGERLASEVFPLLDELASITSLDTFRGRFNRVQSLWFSIADVITPFIASVSIHLDPHNTATSVLRYCRGNTRSEARETARLLRNNIQRSWSLADLAKHAHLSQSQLGRIFVESFGLSPIAYLAALRAEQLARLLTTTDDTIARNAAQVGWSDPSYAARQFRRVFGISPSAFRSSRPSRDLYNS